MIIAHESIIDFLMSKGLSQDLLDKCIDILTTIEMNIEHNNIEDAWYDINLLTKYLIENNPDNIGSKKFINIVSNKLIDEYIKLIGLIHFRNNRIRFNK